MTHLYFEKPADGVEPGPDAEWVELKEAAAPISLDMLRRVGFLSVSFGEHADEYIAWVVGSVAAWHLRDTRGAWLADAPTVADFGRLDTARIKWLIDCAFRATVELPPA